MITTPLDSAELDSKEQYIFYHKMVDFVLKDLIVSIQQKQLLNHQELLIFKQYSDLLLYSIEAMRIKYMYDEEDNMKVDLTESGFPNYLEFRYLFNDLELRNQYLHKLEDSASLKQEFLDTLLVKKQKVKRDKLFQASSIVYYKSVNQQYIFNKFVQGKIIEAPKNSFGEHMTSWSFYDVGSNRPFICYLYFDYEGNRIMDEKEKLYKVLKESADRDMALDTMAYNIDRKLSEIQPKCIKRLDLGPLHNVFAKDENEITHTILKAISNKDIPIESYALSLKLDEVISKNSFKEGSFFSKQILQKWGGIVNKKYLLAPHRIIQLLHNRTPDLLSKLSIPPIEMAELKIEI